MFFLIKFVLLEYVPGGGSTHSLAQVVALGVEALEVTSHELFELCRGLRGCLNFSVLHMSCFCTVLLPRHCWHPASGTQSLLSASAEDACRVGMVPLLRNYQPPLITVKRGALPG